MVLNNSGVDDWNDRIILGNDFFTLVKKHWFNVMMHTTIAQVEFWAAGPHIIQCFLSYRGHPLLLSPSRVVSHASLLFNMHKFPAWYNITSPLPVLTVMVLLGPHLAFGLSRHRRRSQRQLLTWCSNSCSTGWTEYRRRGEPRGWRWSTKGGEEGRVRRRPTSSRPCKKINTISIKESTILSTTINFNNGLIYIPSNSKKNNYL